MKVKPPQLPKEYKRLKLEDAETKINVQPNTMAPPLHTTKGRGARYHGYPGPANSAQLPEEPKGPRLNKACYHGYPAISA